MIEWTAAEERNFQDLVMRAEQQSREYYIRSGGSASPQQDNSEAVGCTPAVTPSPVAQHPNRGTMPPAHTVTPSPVPQHPNRGVTPLPQHHNSRVTPLQQGRSSGTMSNSKTNSNSSRTAPRHSALAITPSPVPQHPNRGVTPPPPPQQQRYKVKRKPNKNPLPEIDSETALLAALLWLLWQEEADITVILAVAYILLV